MSSLKERDTNFVWHPFDQMKGAKIVPIVRGEGAYVFDETGKAYLDAFSSWWVNVHGHAHPKLAKALYEQATQLEHVAFGGFTHPKAVEFSERLLALLPSEIKKIFFSDNGSTSTEVALKMTLQYHYNLGVEKSLFIALENGYHGDTFGSMCVTARGGFNEPFEKHMFEVAFIPAPTRENLNEVSVQVNQLISKGNVAGFIFEPLVQGAGGMLIHDADALSEIIRICQMNEVLCIADEVMTGFGRTGKLFALDHLWAVPDIVCLSKGVTGGFMPLGITAVTDKVYQSFYGDNPKQTFLHGHSYTGNPLACALALENLNIFEEERTLDRVSVISTKMESLSKRFLNRKGVRAVRHLGTILAIELESEGATSYFNTKGKEAYHYLLERGIIMRPLGNVLVLIPPYCISDEELDHVVSHMIGYLEAHY